MIEHRLFVGLGSNLGDRFRNMREAVGRLGAGKDITVVAVSPLYETEPEGVTDQPMFLNGAAECRTGLEPREVLRRFHDVEVAMGRVRNERWGPRTIDLDLLLYDDRVIAEEGLRVPHPRMHERSFVLRPMRDLAPDVVHPVEGLTIETLWEQCRSGRSSVCCSVRETIW